MPIGFFQRKWLMPMVAAAALSVALAVTPCSAQEFAGMNAVPAEHSRPDGSPDSHGECLSKAVRADASAIDSNVRPVAAILEIPKFPSGGMESEGTYSPIDNRDPLPVLFHTRERSPPKRFHS